VAVLPTHTALILAAKRLRSHWTSSPFGKMLEGAGLVLSGGEEANELCECSLQHMIS